MTCERLLLSRETEETGEGKHSLLAVRHGRSLQVARLHPHVDCAVGHRPHHVLRVLLLGKFGAHLPEHISLMLLAQPGLLLPRSGRGLQSGNSRKGGEQGGRHT